MKTLRELKKMSRMDVDAPICKVALLGDTATQLLVTSIRGEAIDRGLNLKIYEAD